MSKATDEQIVMQATIRAWVQDVAYAEDDFVLTFEDGTHTGTPAEVIRLLNALDPEWRAAFSR